jgi:PAS domain S-box-containing protein
MFPRLHSLLAHLLVGSALPLVLFVGVGVIAWVMVTRLVDGLELEKHTREVIILSYKMRQPLDQLQALLQNPPPGPRVLEQEKYLKSRQEYDHLAEKMLELVADNTGQQDLARELKSAAVDLDRILAEQGKRGDVLTRADAQVGEIELKLDEFVSAEGHLLDRRRERVQTQSRQSIVVIAASFVLALFLTLLVSVWVARSVTLPINKLRRAAVALVTGEFRTVSVEGPTELAELIVLFNHMALTLTEKTSALRQEEERYRTYIGAMARILWTTNAAGQVVADLPTWRIYTGQSAEQVLGTGWLDAVHAEDRATVEEAWQAAVAERTVYEIEYRLKSARGEYRHFACRGVPILTANGELREWIGTCTDITDLKQQEALRQAKEAAEAASRAKSEFLARMSHELRTPLNAVIGMSKMLATQRFGPLNLKQADYLTDITRAGEHLLALINDVLDLAKVESGKLDLQAAAFPLSQAVDSLISTLRPLAESKGVVLREVLPPADGTLDTDAGRVRQILYNLLSNAIKFTPAKGEVVVSWEWVATAERDAAVVPETEAQAVRVAVADTGIGIAPEDQELIWDEFRQAKPSAMTAQEGTGLGLALTRRLVRLLGGSIGMQSELGRGSTFTFVIPRRLPPVSAVEENCQDNHCPLGLVIEDHPPTNKLLVDWLAGAGMTTASAYDGQTGLAEARRLHPQLVVLDVQLPRLDGWQVLTALKSDPATATIPVVIVTVGDDRHPVSGLGVQEFFVKPIDRDTFLDRVRDLCPDLMCGDRPVRVLIADDDPMARKLVKEILRVDGLTTMEAGNGREALEMLEKEVPDLIVCDLLMPEMDGFSVVEAVRRRPELKDVPILVLTSQELTREERERLNGRIQALLLKQRLTPQKLRDQLAELGLLSAER